VDQQEDIHSVEPRDHGAAGKFSPDIDMLSTADVKAADDDSAPVAPDLAVDALRAARAITAGHGGSSVRRGGPWGAAGRRRRRSGGSGYSGSGPDARDPAPIGAILGKALPELGWVAPLAQARLMGQWESVVGPEIAARCQPVALVDGELKITAESTAWATQLRLMAPQLLRKITAGLPAGMVRRLVITGPAAPSWKRGPWSMRGGRGARDTYG